MKLSSPNPVVLACALAFLLVDRTAGSEATWDVVDRLLGQAGKSLPGDVHKYAWPRRDLEVTVGGVRVEPALALGSWAGFKTTAPGHVMAMGDLVLLASEVNPVIRALQAGGVDILAVHNHLIGETPPVVYVHFGGHGQPEAMAKALRDALEATNTPLSAAAGAPAEPSAAEKAALDKVQEVLGRRGSMAGRVLQVGVPRAARIEEDGVEVPPSQGMANSMNFQVVDDRVATTGDFVLVADEVNPVIRELEAHGFQVTALHSHMLRESPRLFFMHFWALDDPAKVAGGLRAALGRVAVQAGPEKVSRDFEADAVGAPPAGFNFARTGSGAEGKWIVRVEKGADKNHVLVQESADPTDYRFPIAVLKEGTYKDVTLTVRARPLSGKVDQGFGLVWRYQDANNYYITRCNADEDNCTIYHTVDGRRRAFLNQSVKVATNTWHTLKVEAVGDHFTVWYDGNKVLDAKDATFKDAGKVGLWTKADSVIEFDDLTVEGRLGTLGGLARPAPTPVLQTVAEVPLPGPPVRFDYQSLDQEADRLYIAHMNADRVVVFDVKDRRVVADLEGFERVHGVIAVPATGRVYATVTARHQVAVVDSKTLTVLARVGDIVYPDGLAYAPDADRVYVSDEHGAADAVIDAKTNRLLTSIPLGGEAGNTVYDAGARRILVAVHQKNELVSIDPVSASIVGRASLPGVADPHGVALDTEGRLAFVAGEANATLAVVDLTTMRVLETHKVADHPDVLAFDPAWRRLYVSSESGGVTVFTEAAAGAPGPRLVRDGDIVMPHAHTVAVDPRSHLVYFPLENVDGRPILRIMRSAPPTRPEP